MKRIEILFAVLFAFALAASLASAQDAPTTAPTIQAWDWHNQKFISSVFVGNSAKEVARYEEWLGKPTDAVLGYTGDRDWADYEGSVGWMMGVMKPADRTVLWSVSFIPKKATLAEAAKGTYNEHWLKIAHKFDTWRPEEPIIFIRTGWEFNAKWFHYNAVGKAEDFIGAWRQFVTTFRSVSPRFKFDWCPAGCDWMPMKAEDAYPGDDYVDIIGLDVYDQFRWNKIKDPAKRWNDIYLKGQNGLMWQRNFAKAHDKPMAFSEWGAGGNEAGDNAYFVEKMHEWIKENPVIYASYWNSDSNYKGKISDWRYPTIGEKYKEYWGVPGSAPATQPTTEPAQ